MTLTDKHILYPDAIAPVAMMKKIQAVLESVRYNRDVWLDERMDWANNIYRMAFEWGINPAWLLVGLQRERGLFGHVGLASDFDFAEGFVGADVGIANPLYTGLANQIFMAARGTGWLSGRGNSFGWRPGIAPTVPRWDAFKANRVQLLGADHLPLKASTGEPMPPHVCTSAAEFVQLSYTPHLEVLQLNWDVLVHCCPDFV